MSAPWSGGILRTDGSFIPCCFTDVSYGNWKKEGFKSVWHGPVARHFRKEIAAGNFPCKDCEKCFHNHGNRSKILYPIIAGFKKNNNTVRAAFEHYPIQFKIILTLNTTFAFTEVTEEIKKTLKEYFAALDYLEHQEPTADKNHAQQSLRKLRTIGTIFQSYFEADLTPPVSPYRTVSLINICNARCIHCPGLYSKSITLGVPHKGQYLKKLEHEEAINAFEEADDIIQFYMTGSEFLLFPHWQEIAEILNNAGVGITLSTNGMLLNKRNVDRLIAYRQLQQVNISLDGGSKEIIEKIRRGIKFDRVIDNLRYLIYRLSDMDSNVVISISCVLMKSNYEDIANLVKIVSQAKGNIQYSNITINITSLFAYDHLPDYYRFIGQEHHSRVDIADLRKSFKQLNKMSKKYNIRVNVFGKNWTNIEPSIQNFVAENMPFPSTPAILHDSGDESRDNHTDKI